MPNEMDTSPPDSTLLVDRGALASADFSHADLTLDGNPHSLDLSAIVPQGATWVHLRVEVTPATIPGGIVFFKYSRGSDYTAWVAGSPVVAVPVSLLGMIPIDSDRVIGYASACAPATTIYIAIIGWSI